MLGGLEGYHHIVLAVSGGADSLGMMVIVADWARGLGATAPRFSVATVDHGLRPEAADEAAFVAGLAARFGMEHAVLRWNGDKPAAGLQEAARNARYGLLKDHCDTVGAYGVMLAHHAEDQAETVLMRLCAGSGLSGLAGMVPDTEGNGLRLWRPFLKLSGGRLRATAEAASLTPIEDPSNRNSRFTRVRLRQAGAMLQAEGLDAKRLSKLADRMGRADRALDVMAGRADATYRLPSETGAAWAPGLFDEPDECVVRVILRAIGEMAKPKVLELSSLEAVVEALSDARKSGQSLRRTVGGMIVSLNTNGVLAIRSEGPRGPALHIG